MRRRYVAIAVLGGALASLCVLWLWTSGGRSPSLPERSVARDSSTEPVRTKRSSADADLVALRRRLKAAMQGRRRAVDWLINSQSRGVQVSCEGLSASQGSALSEIVPATKDGDATLIYRRDYVGQVIVDRGGVRGVLRWGEGECSFEELDSQSVVGRVVFDDGEPAADAMVEICGGVARTDEAGRFELTVEPSERAYVAADGVECTVRAVHREGSQSVFERLAIEDPLRLVLNVDVDPDQAEVVADQMARATDHAYDAEADEAAWLRDVLTTGEPPPEVASYLTQRHAELRSGDVPNSTYDVLDAMDSVQQELDSDR